MLTKDKSMQINYMIRKQLSRVPLIDLGELWEISADELDEFLENALKYIDLQD